MKSKKEGAVAAASPSGAGSNVRRKDERTSQRTMNFTGHKVCCIFFILFSLLPSLKANSSSFHRTTSFPSPSPTTVPGSSRALKTVGVQFCDACPAIVPCMLQCHENSVVSIDLSPAGDVLATGSGGW